VTGKFSLSSKFPLRKMAQQKLWPKIWSKYMLRPKFNWTLV